MNNSCIFCKIIKGEIPSQKIKETEDLFVIEDIKPSAPIHFLIISKKHIKDMTEAEDELWIKIKKLSEELASDNSLKGFRLATNVGSTAMIPHMHVHFLSGIKKDRQL